MIFVVIFIFLDNKKLHRVSFTSIVSFQINARVTSLKRNILHGIVWYYKIHCSFFGSLIVRLVKEFPPPTPLQVPQGFYIENNSIDRVFTVVDGIASEGTHIVSSAKKNPPSLDQMWNMTDAGGNGYYFIESILDPNLVLDVEQGNPNSVGQHLILWRKKTDTGNINQLFRWNGNMLESALNPSLLLEIENPWDVDGSKIMTGNISGEYDQRKSWNMIPVLYHTEN